MYILYEVPCVCVRGTDTIHEHMITEHGRTAHLPSHH